MAKALTRTGSAGLTRTTSGPRGGGGVLARTGSRGSDRNSAGDGKRVTLPPDEEPPDINQFAQHLLAKTLDAVLPERIEHGGAHNAADLEHLLTDRVRTCARKRGTAAGGGRGQTATPALPLHCAPCCVRGNCGGAAAPLQAGQGDTPMPSLPLCRAAGARPGYVPQRTPVRALTHPLRPGPSPQAARGRGSENEFRRRD